MCIPSQSQAAETLLLAFSLINTLYVTYLLFLIGLQDIGTIFTLHLFLLRPVCCVEIMEWLDPETLGMFTNSFSLLIFSC